MAGAQLARRELLACSEASESASEGGYDMTPIGIPPDAASELVALRARVAELEAELGRSPEGEGKSGAGSRLAPALESPRRISSSASVPANVLMDKYLGASPMRLLGGRLPWLVALLLLQSTAALVMAMFEELLDRELVIAFFVPMIVGTGGNAGNQPGVAVTRALGLGIPPRGVLWKIMRREASNLPPISRRDLPPISRQDLPLTRLRSRAGGSRLGDLDGAHSRLIRSCCCGVPG